jgi:hypothetical protein
MTTIDKLEPRIEKMVEKVRELSFVFKNKDIENEAEESRNEAIASLENFLELAQQDWDEQPHNEEDEE